MAVTVSLRLPLAVRITGDSDSESEVQPQAEGSQCEGPDFKLCWNACAEPQADVKILAKTGSIIAFVHTSSFS
jgi:hypothetical protein